MPTSTSSGQAESTHDVAQLVERFHLQRAGARPPLADYTRQLWGRRAFILEFSRAKNAVGYSRSVLGQAWQVLTPLLNAGVYYLIFSVLLSTRRGVHNFIAFLVIGIFISTFTLSPPCHRAAPPSHRARAEFGRYITLTSRHPSCRTAQAVSGHPGNGDWSVPWSTWTKGSALS